MEAQESTYMASSEIIHHICAKETDLKSLMEESSITLKICRGFLSSDFVDINQLSSKNKAIQSQLLTQINLQNQNGHLATIPHQEYHDVRSPFQRHFWY